MMINPEERRDLKKANKRLIIFLALVFFLDGFICFLFYQYTNMHPVLNGFLIIVITTFLYLLFMGICAKIDKRKARRLEESGKKDPFVKEGGKQTQSKKEMLVQDRKKSKKNKRKDKKDLSSTVSEITEVENDDKVDDYETESVKVTDNETNETEDE